MIKSEICVESYAGAKIASELAYTSVEINAALDLGGLTPSFGLVRLIADNLQIEKIACLDLELVAFSILNLNMLAC